MPELPTIDVHSPRDPSHRWIINVDDFDPAKYTRWGASHQDRVPEPRHEPPPERLHVPMKPSVDDFVCDEDGNFVAVNIINPEQRNARKEIPYGEYDPDVHQLWSTHNRFQ